MEEKDFMKGYKKKLVALGVEYVHPFDEEDDVGLLFGSDSDKEEMEEKVDDDDNEDGVDK